MPSSAILGMSERARSFAEEAACIRSCLAKLILRWRKMRFIPLMVACSVYHLSSGIEERNVKSMLPGILPGSFGEKFER